MKGEDPVGMVNLDTICPISILFRKFIIRYVFVIRSMEGNRDPIFAGPLFYFVSNTIRISRKRNFCLNIII